MRPVAVAFRRVPAAGTHAPALAEAERALLGPRATQKRRAEFTAGRSAARAALRRFLGPTARDYVVLRDGDSGRPVPFAATGAHAPAFVSITHASGLAVAIAGVEPLGVDLVALEPIERAFREEAFSSDELSAWEAFTGDPPGGDRAACVAFAAKEAAVKWLGTGLTVPLLGVRAIPAGPPRVGLLGRLRATIFTLEVHAFGVHRRLRARLATPNRFVLVAAWGQAEP